MCGIAGLVARFAVNADAVSGMTGLLAHRGPDGSGLWQSQDGRVCLGHRRLSILDLSPAGAQPMADQADEVIITFNGEIYNYIELRTELRALGADFTTGTDTEVLLQAYRHWGDEALTRLNGMFAFALFDRRENRLLLARDRFGEKPLLFAEGDGWFGFASEYKALFALEGQRPDTDDQRLAGFLANPARGFDHEWETPFRQIRQIRPAESLSLDLASMRWTTRRYWEPGASRDAAGLSDADAIAGFRDLLTDSVRLRLRSDVPVGSCLSGGLDSSAIVCIARRLLGDDFPYRTFSGRFPDSPADEGPWIDILARDGTRNDVSPGSQGLLNDLDDFLWANELPVDSVSQYAQYCVFRLARDRGVTVLLDGQGADEVLGGYEQYFAPYLADRQNRGIETDAEEAAIRARYPMALSNRDQRWKTALPIGVKRLASRLTGRGSDFALGLRPEFPPPARASAPTSLVEALKQDACGGFLTTLLRYGDRNSMAHSREVRLPFCDHRIADFVFGLPAQALMGDAQTKRLLRESMRGILPEPIRTRWRKQGFLPPDAQWFGECLLDEAESLFASAEFDASPMWDAPWWRRAARRLRTGETSLARVLWKPFITESWRRRVLPRLASLPRQPIARTG
jgi:asparagine synthase (glutamine-hydrolysing)